MEVTAVADIDTGRRRLMPITDLMDENVLVFSTHKNLINSYF